MITLGLCFTALALIIFAMMALYPCCKWGGKRDNEP